MSTRSLIAVRHEDGSYDSIYLHFDSHPDQAGEALQRHFAQRSQAEELIALGDASSIDRETGLSVHYHRDRGEPWQQCQPRRSQSLDELRELASQEWANFLYVFDDQWRCMKV